MEGISRSEYLKYQFIIEKRTKEIQRINCLINEDRSGIDKQWLIARIEKLNKQIMINKKLVSEFSALEKRV